MIKLDKFKYKLNYIKQKYDENSVLHNDLMWTLIKKYFTFIHWNSSWCQIKK